MSEQVLEKKINIAEILEKIVLPPELSELFGKIQELFRKTARFATGEAYQKYVRCGNKNCHCNRDRGHGPYWYAKRNGKEIYLGKHPPENFFVIRFQSKEIERLIELYAKIELAFYDLKKDVRDFLIDAETTIEQFEELKKDE